MVDFGLSRNIQEAIEVNVTNTDTGPLKWMR
jgi:hypothetical protein